MSVLALLIALCVAACPCLCEFTDCVCVYRCAKELNIEYLNLEYIYCAYTHFGTVNLHLAD